MTTSKTYPELIVYTDGGARGNPGPAALGVAIHAPDGSLVAKRGKYLGEQTNNYAEYSALIFALQEAKKMGATRVQCFMDSELVVRQLAGMYRVKNKGLQPLHEKVKALACDFEKITFAHVRREKNKIADGMVNTVLDQMAA